LGWLWGAYQLAINRLCGGFEVALGGLRGLPPLFLLSTFCFLFWLGGGFARLFEVRSSRFKVQGSILDVQPSMFGAFGVRHSSDMRDFHASAA
jgi:hypothetical protein